MSVKLDSNRTAEVSPEEARHIDYGYAVQSLKGNCAERVIATGDCLTQHVFQGVSAKTDQTLYAGTATLPQEFAAAKELTSLEIVQPAKQQHDFGF
jgi:hypothetical protein